MAFFPWNFFLRIIFSVGRYVASLPDGRSRIWTWSEVTESADGDEIELVVQVVEHVAVVLEVWKDSVVVEDVVGSLGFGMKLGPEEVLKGSVDVGTEWMPPG